MFRTHHRRCCYRTTPAEMLENRVCLDASMAMIADTLIIQGGLESEQLVLSDAGEGVVFASHSALDGGRIVRMEGVRHVIVETNSGEDTVSYDMLNPQSGISDIQVDLGAGPSNNFLFHAAPGSGRNNPVTRISVLGHEGRDVVRIAADEWAGKLIVHADLGGGNDSFQAGVTTSEQNSGIVDPGGAVGFNPQPDPPAIQFAVSTGSGNDMVDLQLRLSSGDHNVAVNLGEGNDMLSAAFHGAADPPPELEIIPCIRVAIQGEAGDDRVQVNLAEFSGGWDADVQLGRGDDRLMFSAIAPAEASSLLVRAGAGNDLVDILFSGLGRPTTSPVHFAIYGEDGNDVLRLAVTGISDPDWLDAFLDGGPGYDLVRAPRTAHTANAEA